MKQICQWAKSDPLMTKYHNQEWGVPIYDDRKIFEFLVLESAQAGLSWMTVLKKRENYRLAFTGFDPQKVAKFGSYNIEKLLNNPGIIRNHTKIEAAINNAKRFLQVQEEFESFAKYIWNFVDNNPINHKFKKASQIPAITNEAELLSADLKKRGFKFVGPTICYSHMQATGMVNDHTTNCFRHQEILKLNLLSMFKHIGNTS